MYNLKIIEKKEGRKITEHQKLVGQHEESRVEGPYFMRPYYPGTKAR